MTRQAILLIILTTTIFSCRKGQIFLYKEKGIVINAGVQDCPLIIQADDGTVYEAFDCNPNSFKINDKVKFTYKRGDFGSFCMRGEPITIKSISKY